MRDQSLLHKQEGTFFRLTLSEEAHIRAHAAIFLLIRFRDRLFGSSFVLVENLVDRYIKLHLCRIRYERDYLESLSRHLWLSSVEVTRYTHL